MENLRNQQVFFHWLLPLLSQKRVYFCTLGLMLTIMTGPLPFSSLTFFGILNSRNTGKIQEKDLRYNYDSTYALLLGKGKQLCVTYKSLMYGHRHM